ncbi:hypothetical protein CCACVL1_00581, partial [Corchorus capsularis]
GRVLGISERLWISSFDGQVKLRKNGSKIRRIMEESVEFGD